MNHVEATIAALGLCAGLASTASGQVVVHQDFEGLTYDGWTVNGNQEIFFGGNPGSYMGVGYLDFWGVTLRNDDLASPMVGDLTVFPSLTVTVDVRVLQLNNFFEEPIDPSNFNLVLEAIDYENYASVFFVGAPLPQLAEGWTSFEFSIPDTTQAALPPGWRGSGAEDPVTFEPILPPGRTWNNVLQNVDEFRLSTMEPGYFYSSNFWEMGFDNLVISVPTSCGSADFDGDGDSGTDLDIEAFFACLGGSCCATCGSADFDGDGDSGTDLDIEAFFLVLGGGNC